jgi:NAD(P)H dehydrogenase (quinone)
MSIAVTGGNGEFGSTVLKALGKRTREPLVATVRDLARARRIEAVDYRPGDFDRPDSLRAALSGVDVVLINATFFGADPSLRRRRVSSAISAAAEAGVSRIVMTSWPDLDDATLPAVQDYKHLEALVKTAGPAWTILRFGYGLAIALARDVVWARAGGELVAPAGGARVTPADVTDLAEAAAVVLTQPGHDSLVHELSGPDSITWEQLAGLAKLPFRAVTDDAYRDYLARFNLPAEVAQGLIDMYADFRSNWASTPTATLGELIGHAPVPGVEAVNRGVSRFPAG